RRDEDRCARRRAHRLRGSRASSVAARVEAAIAGVSESGDDELLRVELGIDRADVDLALGELLLDAANRFLRRDDREQLQTLDAPTSQSGERGARRPSRGEHRVEHESDFDRATVGQAAVVLDRSRRGLVAIEPEMPDLRVRDELEERVDHTEARPEEGDEPDSPRDDVSLRDRERRLDVDRLDLEVGRRVESEEDGEALDERAELL